METDLFPTVEGGPRLSTFPLEGWMAEALKANPDSDREALARVPSLELRRECFVYVMDFRQRGPAILEDMAAIVRNAIRCGRTGIGGASLAGALRLGGECVHEIGNEVACFYVFVLSQTHPELAPHLKSDGDAAAAMRKTGWKP